MILDVNFLLQLQCNIMGREIKFMVIMVVVIILVVVVSIVFIRIIVRVSFFCKCFRIIFMVFNSCLVMLDCFSMDFKKMKKGIVSRVLLVIMLKIFWGMVDKNMGLKEFKVVLMMVNKIVIFFREKVMGQLQFRKINVFINIIGFN